MWMTLCLVSFVWVSTTQADDFCENVFSGCKESNVSWTRCYDYKIRKCTIRGRGMLNFIKWRVNSSQEAEESPTPEHRVHIPSSALQTCRGDDPEEEVQLVITVLSSTYFKLSSPLPKERMRVLRPSPPVHRQGTVMGESVLVVKAGNSSVRNLPQPIKLIFKHNNEVENGTCVFWEESELGDGTGHWSEVSDTFDNGTHFICSCYHLSFFAVLVNPKVSVDKRNAENLNYITYTGSALSVFFTAISLIIYICLQRQRPEKAIGLHMQLTGALLCLHLSFLLCSFWVQLLNKKDDWVCGALGFFLHWSLLATISWTALEGFHLYLLLVRVFNIYVRRYLLKLSLVGWGLPTLIAVACGISGVYGKYSLKLTDANNSDSTVQMCWMSSKFPQRLLVSYITTVAFPCLVILYNSCMLGLVVFKLWGRKIGDGGWNKMNRKKWSRLWKDCATVLGLSCVLGLPWGLASTTFMSLAGIYIFTILNSLQGVFVVLWSIALTCASRSNNNSSVKDSSSQKMMTTSLYWTALEGFHLYLLLVRVFNIYVRRYLLKLSLVGWGLPTLIAVACGISGVYGKYSLKLTDANNSSSTVQMCWMSSEFPQRLLVSYITTVAFPCLVILYNSCMLGLVVFKLWGRKIGDGGWNKMNRKKWSRLWKDCATVLGLSCVLGLPWGLASTTFMSLAGIYIFTILNSLQGVFVVLWSIALTCASRSDNNSSVKDSSSQKMMTTSL